MGEREEKFLASAPKLRQSDVDAINALFTPYVFRREKTGEVWTTCCRKQAKLPPWHSLWDEPHECEPKYRYLGRRPNGKSLCPFCGKTAKIKDVRYSGQRKNLWEEQHVVVLRAVRGELWACAAWAVKDYSRDDFCAPPYVRGGSTYRFGKKAATWVYQDWYYGARGLRREEYKNLNTKTVDKPFAWTSQWGDGYYVIAIDELKKTPVAYCGGEAFLEEPCDFMKFLHLAFARPRQVEMLHKFGLDEVITDLLNRGKKHVALFDWNEKDPQKSFGLTFEEIREAKAAKADAWAMEKYKWLKKRGEKTSFKDIVMLHLLLNYNAEEILKKTMRLGVKPKRLARYFLKNDRSPHIWKDYVDMAEVLGWDLNEESVLLPKDLQRRHGEATAENNERLHQIFLRKHREEAEKQKIGLKKRHKKYDFEMNGFFIRLANNPMEILQEGKTLQHCVGGYAERHMSGVTSILFLRRKDAPETSLYTIEMLGDRLQQIHGFQNERDGAPKPRLTMAWLLEPWLAWIAAGSKRDKKGNPKIPQLAEKTA